MEKIKIGEVGTKFKELPKDTLSRLKYNQEERKLTLEIFGFTPFLVCCTTCESEKFVKEGALFRCLECNSLHLIGFGTNSD